MSKLLQDSAFFCLAISLIGSQTKNETCAL